MEKKVVNVVLDLTGEAGERLHEAIQLVLFSKGFCWGNGRTSVQKYGDTPLYFVMDSDGKNKVIWQLRREDGISVKATDILSGAFDIDKWIKGNTKKEPDNVVYCVDLTWVKGDAREVLSTALQKKAFEKGYKWSGVSATPKYMDQPGLFFDTGDKTIYYASIFEEGKQFIKSNPVVEISVNKALRGEYRSVK